MVWAMLMMYSVRLIANASCFNNIKWRHQAIYRTKGFTYKSL